MALILVVDDDPDIRYVTQVNLEIDNHRVMTAANGTDALAAVQVEKPDVVLLDVVMPDVDGWSVLETIKAHLDEAVSSVKVLMMTSLDDDTDRLRGGIEGAIRYLVKPVSPTDLREAVAEALGGGPEAKLRRQAQTGALSELARREKGLGEVEDDQPRPRLSKLERTRPHVEDSTTPVVTLPEGVTLTDKQTELLRTLASSPSVSAGATELGVSRSNVYASLRRVSRKLEIDSVPELLRQLRAGLIAFEE